MNPDLIGLSYQQGCQKGRIWNTRHSHFLIDLRSMRNSELDIDQIVFEHDLLGWLQKMNLLHGANQNLLLSCNDTPNLWRSIPKNHTSSFPDVVVAWLVPSISLMSIFSSNRVATFRHTWLDRKRGLHRYAISKACNRNGLRVSNNGNRSGDPAHSERWGAHPKNFLHCDSNRLIIDSAGKWEEPLQDFSTWKCWNEFETC